MKTIFRTLAILLVATLVAGAAYAIISNTSSNAPFAESGQRPSFNGSTTEGGFPARPDGDFDRERSSGFSPNSLGGLLGTFAKLSGLVILVLLIEKAVEIVKRSIPRNQAMRS